MFKRTASTCPFDIEDEYIYKALTVTSDGVAAFSLRRTVLRGVGWEETDEIDHTTRQPAHYNSMLLANSDNHVRSLTQATGSRPHTQASQ
jgi:hypothetical protein